MLCLALAYGIEPIHFGIIFLAAMEASSWARCSSPPSPGWLLRCLRGWAPAEAAVLQYSPLWVLREHLDVGCDGEQSQFPVRVAGPQGSFSTWAMSRQSTILKFCGPSGSLFRPSWTTNMPRG